MLSSVIFRSQHVEIRTEAHSASTDQPPDPADIARYSEQVSQWMLPHVEKRLLAIVRCPNGRAKPCFFQKHPAEAISEHFLRVKVEETTKTEEYIAVHNAEGLIALAQMGVLEIHQWGSKRSR